MFYISVDERVFISLIFGHVTVDSGAKVKRGVKSFLGINIGIDILPLEF